MYLNSVEPRELLFESMDFKYALIGEAPYASFVGTFSGNEGVHASGPI